MKAKYIAPGFAMLLLVLTGAPLNAADTYEAALKAGDENRASKKFDLALNDYDAAVKSGVNDTQIGLALGKKGMVYAYDKKDFEAARKAADEALQLQDTESIARVTALEVLAECQMKADKDNNAAAETLEKALKLEGVDWSKPHLTLKLGDAYRFSGKFELAVATYQKVPEMSDANQGIKAVTYLNIGLTYQYSPHDNEKAKAAYAKAAELKPDLQKEIEGHLAKIK